MSVALDLHRFYQQVKNQERHMFTTYTFHAPGAIFYFKNPEEIRAKAKLIAASILRNKK